KSMGWKALAPPVLGWHQLGWKNRERSNGRDFYSSACSDLLRGGRWRLKALDAGAGENENDNDPTFLTACRQEYRPHTPHRYLVAARVAHRSQRGRSAVRVRSRYSRCPKNSIEQPSMQELRHALSLHHKIYPHLPNRLSCCHRLDGRAIPAE